MQKLKVLVICHDVVGKNMAGPGIRYQYVAKVLGNKFHTKLAVLSDKSRSSDDVVVVDPKSRPSWKHIEEADVIFAQWLSREMIRYATDLGKVIIFDLYAPVPIEYLANLEFSRHAITKDQLSNFEAVVGMYKEYLDIGQFFACSNERQRDFWAGYLTASNLFSFKDFSQNLIQNNFLICPMGIEIKKPNPKKLLLRNTTDGLKKDDFVLVWTGGIWDWFDAQLVVKAMSVVNDSSIKLVFLGTKHPNSVYTEEMNESVAARRLASELGLLGRTVFFRDGWIPYEERAAYFLDSDAAIYADKDTLETRFSHRTRVLDHFWAELPTICSEGDYMSEIINQKGLGLTVRRSSGEFAKAITDLKNDKNLYRKIKDNLKTHRGEFSWESSLSPLVKALESLDPSVKQFAIKEAAAQRQKNQRLPFKRRIRRSAKILLKGR